MQGPEFEALCRGIKQGEERYVEEQTLHATGKVLACQGNTIQVDADGKRQSWPSANCRERWDLQKG